jgi:predicted nucleic acid-binding protein
MPGNFFDTNVLIYVVSGDAVKAEAASSLLQDGGTISVQVLNEIVNVLRRKLRRSWLVTHDFLTFVRTCLVVRPVTVATHDAGLEIAERYGLAIYDSMIVAAALEADCDTLWSEDMHHGLVIAGRLRVVNPFQQRG